MSHKPTGTVHWIGLRPKRREPLTVVDHAIATAGKGLQGDHRSQRPGSKRQVTFIQAEHLKQVGEALGQGPADPGLTRRNVVVQGIDLLTLQQARFRVGQATFEGTGLCVPCERMEENLGPGGLQAMYGHGGITARIVDGGSIRTGDSVIPLGTNPVHDSA